MAAGVLRFLTQLATPVVDNVFMTPTRARCATVRVPLPSGEILVAVAPLDDLDDVEAWLELLENEDTVVDAGCQVDVRLTGLPKCTTHRRS